MLQYRYFSQFSWVLFSVSIRSYEWLRDTPTRHIIK